MKQTVFCFCCKLLIAEVTTLKKIEQQIVVIKYCIVIHFVKHATELDSESGNIRDTKFMFIFAET